MKKLGQGSYGTAFKVRDSLNGEVLVMKQIPLNSNNPGDMNDKLKECSVMKRIRHPNIVRFKNSFVS
jgi:serine/threonine protein kinase